MTFQEIYSLYKQSTGICTDSRHCHPGEIFLALQGPNFDGNNYALQALQQGCSYAIISAAAAVIDPAGDYHSRLITVADTLQTYKAIAREHRREHDIPVLAITGTNGKTTTKELVAAVLSTTYNIMYTPGNLNNDIGVPQTLLTMHHHDLAIIEMGASHIGDIATLADTAEPTCGLITNIGRAHLQGFGSVDNIIATKGELYDYLSEHHAFAFVNTADDTLMTMVSDRKLNYIPYVAGRVTAAEPYITVTLSDGTAIHTHLIGDYNCANVCAAVTIGRHFAVPQDRIIYALEHYEPSNNRSQRTITDRNELIIDAYNANPSSMAAAIQSFANMPTAAEKMLILGEMAELGNATHDEHQAIVDLLITLQLPHVWLVGQAFQHTTHPFRAFSTVDELSQELTASPLHRRCILVKGSHATNLTTIIPLL